MNNALITTEDEMQNAQPLLRERVTQLTEIIEALEKIGSSSYWTILQQNVFDVDLSKAKSRLAKEKDTTEIFRLQGEIRWGEKFSLENMLSKYRNELLGIRKQL